MLVSPPPDLLPDATHRGRPSGPRCLARRPLAPLRRATTKGKMRGRCSGYRCVSHPAEAVRGRRRAVCAKQTASSKPPKAAESRAQLGVIAVLLRAASLCQSRSQSKSSSGGRGRGHGADPPLSDVERICAHNLGVGRVHAVRIDLSNRQTTLLGRTPPDSYRATRR